MASLVFSEPSILTESLTWYLIMFSMASFYIMRPSVIMLAFKPRSFAWAMTWKRSFRRNGCPPVTPKKVAPKSEIWSTIFNAAVVSSSCKSADLPADVQCTQLLSHWKVHRQGTINKGPFSFKPCLLQRCNYACKIMLFNTSRFLPFS